MENKITHSHEFVRAFATMAIHEGIEVDPATGAVIPPIHVSSTYEVELDTPPVSVISHFLRNSFMDDSTIQPELALRRL